MVKKKLRMRSKNAGIDVTLHADFIFDITFARGCMEIDHLKMSLFTMGFLKEMLKATLSKSFVSPEGNPQ